MKEYLSSLWNVDELSLKNANFQFTIYKSQIPKNDLTRLEITNQRVICSIDNLIRLIYILKENNLQNINPICETNPLNIYISFNSYKRQSHPNSIVEFLQIKNIKIAVTLYISYRVPRPDVCNIQILPSAGAPLAW